MKIEVLKSFSSFGCDCQLQLVHFSQSSQEVYQVLVRYCVTPKDWNSNYQVMTFGQKESCAMDCFKQCIQDFI